MNTKQQKCRPHGVTACLLCGTDTGHRRYVRGTHQGDSLSAFLHRCVRRDLVYLTSGRAHLEDTPEEIRSRRKSAARDLRRARELEAQGR